MHLLDVNVLIAICDPMHDHHKKSRLWFERYSKNGWATCPLTENGFVRITGQKAYPNGPQTPKGALNILNQLISLPGHQFWKDSVSISDKDLFGNLKNIGHKQLTDLYLLGLATSRSGKLVSLDTRMLQGTFSSFKKSLLQI